MDNRPSKQVVRPGGKYWSSAITDDQYREKMRANVVVDANGCWVWQGFVHKPPREYGETSYRGKPWRCHRLAVHLFKGPIPKGHVVCHTCDNQRCCNPDHLFTGTQLDNLVDSIVKKRHRCAGATECPRGHKYDAENTYIVKKANGATARACRSCQRERYRRYWREQPERMKQRQRTYRARKLQESANG